MRETSPIQSLHEEEARSSSYNPGKRINPSKTKAKFGNSQESEDPMNQTKTKFRKANQEVLTQNTMFKAQEGENSRFETKEHEFENYLQGSTQLPYINHSKIGTMEFKNHYESPYMTTKSNWKNTAKNFHPVGHQYHPVPEGLENDVKHYNIVYNNNIFNYNINGSPYQSVSRKKI